MQPPGGVRYRGLLALAGGAVLWERLWPRLWQAACILGAFVAVALFDVLPHLPDWLHAAILALWGMSFAAALVWAWPAMRPVGRAAARTRLERDNGLVDRPLAALEDHLATGRRDPLAEALWRRHQLRMAATVHRLKVRLPHPQMARHEPWGIRAGVLMLLVVAVVVGRDDGDARLVRALDPGIGSGRTPPLVEMWITPPAYTGAVPMFFTTASLAAAGAAQAVAPAAASGGVIAVPRGSTLLARTAGVSRAPRLGVGAVDAAFTALGADADTRAWSVEAAIDAGERIVVRAGRQTLADWPIAVIADAAPQVAFAKPPEQSGNGLLAIDYQASDDYGVTEVMAVVESAGPGSIPGAGAAAQATTTVPLPLTTPGGKDVTGGGLQDVAAHPLAGQPVRLHMEARDGAGQSGRSPLVDMVLPERTFTHPVARALVALRKRLFAPAPEVRAAVGEELGALATQPSAFRNDVVVSLALAVAKGRLRFDQSDGAVASVRDLLWETALRIEQGDVPFAERQVEEARQKLMDALNRNAGQAEIERLMDELQQALDRYLAAAAAELARRGDQAMPIEPQSTRADDLKDLIEMARQLARAGGREGAMQMLAELQKALDGMRSGLRSGQPNKELAEAQALMKAMRDLADRQQSLLDDSFQKLRDQQGTEPRGGRPSAGREQGPGQRPGQRPRPGQGQRDGQGQSQNQGSGQGHGQSAKPGSGPSAGAGGGAQKEQQALRSDLGELMLRMNEFLGSIPGQLGEADQAMRDAVEQLGQGRLGEAVPSQTRAVEALDRALDAAGQEMAQKLGGMIGLGNGEQPGGDGLGDIFGRARDGRRGFATGAMKIPDRSDLGRAQEILDELRRRAAERSRPRDELDYIDRLLRRF